MIPKTFAVSEGGRPGERSEAGIHDCPRDNRASTEAAMYGKGSETISRAQIFGYLNCPAPSHAAHASRTLPDTHGWPVTKGTGILALDIVRLRFLLEEVLYLLRFWCPMLHLFRLASCGARWFGGFLEDRSKCGI